MKIRVVPIFAIEGWERVSIEDASKIAIVSIRTTEKEIVFTDEKIQKFGLPKDQILNLIFGDITPKIYKRIVAEAHRKGKNVEDIDVFSKRHAEQLVKFINRLKDRIELFVVHCDAGISRSGAVGTWLCDYLRLDYNEFKRENPHILPNQHILDVLRRFCPETRENDDGEQTSKALAGLRRFYKGTVKRIGDRTGKSIGCFIGRIWWKLFRRFRKTDNPF